MGDIDGVLQAVLTLQGKGIVAGGLGSGDDAGSDRMMDRAKTEIDLIIGIDIILQVLFQVEVADIRCDIDVVIVGIDTDLVAVITIDQRGIGEKPAVKDMIPAGSSGGIAIIDAKGLAESQVIPPEITGEIDPVALVDPVITFYVQVIEIKAVAVDGRVTR